MNTINSDQLIVQALRQLRIYSTMHVDMSNFWKPPSPSQSFWLVSASGSLYGYVSNNRPNLLNFSVIWFKLKLEKGVRKHALQSIPKKDLYLTHPISFEHLSTLQISRLALTSH